jgi:hypothetical protein
MLPFILVLIPTWIFAVAIPQGIQSVQKDPEGKENNAVNQVLDGLQNQIDGLNSLLKQSDDGLGNGQELQEKINDIEAKLQSVNGNGNIEELQTLQADIDSVQIEIEDAGLNAKNGDIQQQAIQSVQEGNENNAGKEVLDGLQKQIDDLNSLLKQSDDDQGGLQGLEKKINDIEAKLQSGNGNGNLEDLQTVQEENDLLKQQIEDAGLLSNNDRVQIQIDKSGQQVANVNDLQNRIFVLEESLTTLKDDKGDSQQVNDFQDEIDDFQDIIDTLIAKGDLREQQELELNIRRLQEKIDDAGGTGNFLSKLDNNTDVGISEMCQQLASCRNQVEENEICIITQSLETNCLKDENANKTICQEIVKCSDLKQNSTEVSVTGESETLTVSLSSNAESSPTATVEVTIKTPFDVSVDPGIFDATDVDEPVAASDLLDLFALDATDVDEPVTASDLLDPIALDATDVDEPVTASDLLDPIALDATDVDEPVTGSDLLDPIDIDE